MGQVRTRSCTSEATGALAFERWTSAPEVDLLELSFEMYSFFFSPLLLLLNSVGAYLFKGGKLLARPSSLWV